MYLVTQLPIAVVRELRNPAVNLFGRSYKRFSKMEMETVERKKFQLIAILGIFIVQDSLQFLSASGHFSPQSTSEINEKDSTMAQSKGT